MKSNRTAEHALPVPVLLVVAPFLLVEKVFDHGLGFGESSDDGPQAGEDVRLD